MVDQIVMGVFGLILICVSILFAIFAVVVFRQAIGL